MKKKNNKLRWYGCALNELGSEKLTQFESKMTVSSPGYQETIKNEWS